MITQNTLIRIFLGVVFLIAGLMRLILPQIAIGEMTILGLPLFFSYLIIVFELSVSLLLFLNKYTTYVFYAIIVFLIVALFNALRLYTQVTNTSDLFVFNLTGTDIFLHMTFIFIVGLNLLNIKNQQRV